MAFIDVLEQFRNYLKGILDSSNERENEAETIDNIRKGINFKGSNLWVLIFAIFIASLGLNVNSSAVIIGAIPFNGTDHGYRLRGRNQRL